MNSNASSLTFDPRGIASDHPPTHPHFSTPRGGGWRTWSEALLRLLERMGHQPTQSVIIHQRLLNNRYVQLQIGHGVAHAEASSNVYLTGDWRLDQSDLGTSAQTWRSRSQLSRRSSA